jgi:hypothetical protein
MRSGTCHLPFSEILFRRNETQVIHGIEVRGGMEFRQSTGDALALLQALNEFALIRTHLGVIRQGKRSGVRIRATRAIFTVGAPTWSHSVLWYAGTIAHDAYHAKLYHDAKLAHPTARPHADDWTGVAAEKACLGFQRAVLMMLNAPPSILNYVDSQRQNPTYQGRAQAWRRWLDYRKRWW